MTSLDQFEAALDLIEHRLTNSVPDGTFVFTLRQIKRNELCPAAVKVAEEDLLEGAVGSCYADY